MERKRWMVAAGLAFLASAAMARPEYNQVLRETYKPSPKSALATDTCATCHVGSTLRRNRYGKDLQKAMAEMKVSKVTPAVLRKVEKLDSDGDGVPNGVELRAGSLPGDPYVKPAVAKTGSKASAGTGTGPGAGTRARPKGRPAAPRTSH